MRTAAKVLVLVLGVVVLVFAFACGSTTTTDTTGASQGATTSSSSGSVSQSSSTTQPSSATTVAAGNVGTSREDPVPLGQEAQVGDWKVKVVEATSNANEVVASANEFNDPPQAGNQYVLVKVQATRTGEEPVAFWVDTYYSFVGSGGNTFDTAFEAVPDGITDTGEAFKDASITGSLVFEVPSAQVAGGLLMMEEAFSIDNSRTFFAIQ